jgi:hypothetical protein
MGQRWHCPAGGRSTVPEGRPAENEAGKTRRHGAEEDRDGRHGQAEGGRSGG